MPTVAPPAQTETAHPGDTAPQRRAERAPAPTEAPGDAAPGERPSDRRATGTWVQATDASGTVRSKREMPEPDSPGG